MNNEKINTNLEFKDHRDFFEDYNVMRKRAFILLSESITDKKKIPELYKTSVALIDFTSNYTPNIDEIDELLKKIDKEIKLSNHSELIERFRELLRLLNSKHESSSILPQKSNTYAQSQKFWREEENKAIKEMKKAFYDIFKV